MQVPEPIPLDDHVFDFAFHPKESLLVAGLITGHVHCYRYGVEGNQQLWSTQLSKKSCRGVEFTPEGSVLISISRDRSIQKVDVQTGRLLMRMPKAHKYPINKMCLMDENMMATGDDEGVVKIWDQRTQKAVKEYKVHEDFIADMVYNPGQGPSLVVAGGDGRLSVHDLRADQPTGPPEPVEDELLCLSILKNGTQVVAGSQSGALYLWQWGEWKTKTPPSGPDRWVGHPSSVDSQCKLDEETICTGGSDGILRLVTIVPKRRFEGVLGDHGEDFPVERVRMTAQQDFLGSCGHDLQLRFWDVGFLFEQETSKPTNTFYHDLT